MARLRGKHLRDQAGNTALMFALIAPVLLFLVGGSIDLNNMSVQQSQLQLAADAAAVAAVARTSPGYTYAVNTMTSAGPVPDSVTLSGLSAVFSANWPGRNDITTPKLTGGSCGGSTFVCKQTPALSTITVSSKITASAVYSTDFLRLLGINTINLSATSTAADNVPSYVDFYMLLDNSPSMGLGAETPDINTLVNVITAKSSSEKNCAFACHSDNSSEDIYDMVVAYNAKVAGTAAPQVQLRINEVAQATSSLMSTASSIETSNGMPAPATNCGASCATSEFRVALYDFGPKAYINPPWTMPYQVSTLTYDLQGQAASNALNVQLQTVPNQNQAYDGANNDTDTDLNGAMTKLGTIMVPKGTAGSGQSSSAPQQVMFIVTDGMVDSSASGRTLGPISASTCTAIKNKGIKIAILYTTYLPSALTSDSWSMSNVYPIVSPTDKVAAALSSCASPGFFQPVAPDGVGIASAMKTLFQTVVASVRVTG